MTAPRAVAAVRARHAASLIVLRRRDGDAPTMLMGLRGTGHRFMPSRLVFPGGGVDPGDRRVAVASPMPPHVQALVERSAKPALAQAIAVAAARELEEETGLTLGRPPQLAGFDYLGRLVTPPDSPVRFNARFFVVDAGWVSGALAGSGELEGLRWFTLDEALAIDLARPTRAVIELLRQWLAMTSEQRVARSELPVMRNRRWVPE